MPRKQPGITRLWVEGFKSIATRQEIEIAPLTVLAGANSSGKSSLLQPLLLLKQTLEAPGDPGALLLDGPNVRFTSVEQVLTRRKSNGRSPRLSIGMETAGRNSLELQFVSEPGRGFETERMVYESSKERLDLRRGMSAEDIAPIVPRSLRESVSKILKKPASSLKWEVNRSRCFLGISLTGEGRTAPPGRLSEFSYGWFFVSDLISVIHLPGLRGNPRRTYPKASPGPQFPGTFDSYAASVVARWRLDRDARLAQLGSDLAELGLTWKVTTRDVDDTQMELLVGRLPRPAKGGARDLVSIADVGFGVSQSLSVLVALLAAVPGQLVYIEQPEIHLHPRAQRMLTHLLCRTAKRGVRLVIETHSALLLRELQTLVARGEMARDDVRLHWVQRDEAGETVVKTAQLDAAGAYGDWPQDFDATDLDAERDYLDAVEARGHRGR